MIAIIKHIIIAVVCSVRIGGDVIIANDYFYFWETVVYPLVI